MVRREQRRVPRSRGRRTLFRRTLFWLPDVLVIGLVLFAFAAWNFDLGARWGLLAPDPLTQPAQVAAPAGLDLPALHAAPTVAKPLTGAQASPGKIAKAVRRPLLNDSRLGPSVAVRVDDLSTGRVLYEHGPRAVTPASTMKLLTSVAALQTIGPATRFDTTVRQVPGSNRIVLVGGGDPFLASKPTTRPSYPPRADLVTLARRTAIELRKSGTRKVRLSYDDSLFSGPLFSPGWPGSYQSEGVVPPITALWVDEGKPASGPGFVAAPSRTAAQVFGSALARQQIEVVGRPLSRVAPKASRQIASVSSAPLGQIVSRMLLVSDNNAAEVVAHHVGLKQGKGGSFAGGVSGVRMALRQLGVPLAGAVIHDGSGLSRQDQLRPATELGVLRAAASADHPALRQVLTGLPVSGFTGSLAHRFDTGEQAARGRVRAKTGTLSGVHGLTGVATDLDGDVLGFVVIADRVPAAYSYLAEAQIDEIAAALGGCHCRT